MISSLLLYTMAVVSHPPSQDNSVTSAHIPSAVSNIDTVASKLGDIRIQANELPDTEPLPNVNGNVPNGTDAPPSQKTGELKPDPKSRLETVASYPVSNLKLEDRLIDDFRPLRVAVIGAGLSGILSGILLPEKVPNVQLTIFEKSKEVVSSGCITSPRLE